jgi:FAD synthase
VPQTLLKQQTIIGVEIVARLREIQKFSQKDRLVSQITQDVVAVKTILGQTH